MGLLESLEVSNGMDGKGKAFDNVFVERLWRTVKYEEVYIKNYYTVTEARRLLRDMSTFTIPRGFTSLSLTKP